jgi:ankyrin repeat protein
MSSVHDLFEKLEPLLASGSAHEVKARLSVEEAKLSPTYLCSPSHRLVLRTAATKAAAYENMAVVRYFCEERGVPANFVPWDELAEGQETEFATPLLAAIQTGHEDIAMYLLLLPPGEDGRNLNLDGQIGPRECPLLLLAAQAGLVRVVEALLALGVDLMARDSDGDLAVSLAVSMCHIEVVNVLLEAGWWKWKCEGVAGVSMPAKHSLPPLNV